MCSPRATAQSSYFRNEVPNAAKGQRRNKVPHLTSALCFLPCGSHAVQRVTVSPLLQAVAAAAPNASAFLRANAKNVVGSTLNSWWVERSTCDSIPPFSRSSTCLSKASAICGGTPLAVNACRRLRRVIACRSNRPTGSGTFPHKMDCLYRDVSSRANTMIRKLASGKYRLPGPISDIGRAVTSQGAKGLGARPLEARCENAKNRKVARMILVGRT